MLSSLVNRDAAELVVILLYSMMSGMYGDAAELALIALFLMLFGTLCPAGQATNSVM